MDVSDKLNSIPRGNTCKGVNRLVAEKLLAEFGTRPFSVIDVPCGKGEFLDAVRDLFPGSERTGADISSPVGDFGHRFMQFNGEHPPESTGERFDAVTCISGVMEFDNTLGFFRRVREMVDDEGVFIITNDNLLSVRDRLMYLFGGRFGQYPFQTDGGVPTWKIIPVQNLIRLLHEAGFIVGKFEYVPVLGPHWLGIVLALPLFAIQYLMNRSSDAIKRDVFSLRSFLSRHYVISCYPEPARRQGSEL